MQIEDPFDDIEYCCVRVQICHIFVDHVPELHDLLEQTAELPLEDHLRIIELAVLRDEVGGEGSFGRAILHDLGVHVHAVVVVVAGEGVEHGNKNIGRGTFSKKFGL